jgi:hypothetical protein
MRVTLKKSTQGKKNPPLGAATMPYFSAGSGFHHLRERNSDVVTCFAIIAIIPVYAVMAVALFRWSVYAPIFQRDSGAVAEQAFPWRQ